MVGEREHVDIAAAVGALDLGHARVGLVRLGPGRVVRLALVAVVVEDVVVVPSAAEIVLVVRDEFRVEDNEGKLLARRVQVRLSSLCTDVRARLTWTRRPAAPARPCLGDVDTQEPGPDDPARQDRLAECVRERWGLRVPSSKAARVDP